jgi:hypothetical protein
LFFVVTEDWYFHSHRLTLALHARDAGYRVSVATRCARHAASLRAHGLDVIDIPFDRSLATSTNCSCYMRQHYGDVGEWWESRGLPALQNKHCRKTCSMISSGWLPLTRTGRHERTSRGSAAPTGV